MKETTSYSAFNPELLRRHKWFRNCWWHFKKLIKFLFFPLSLQCSKLPDFFLKESGDIMDISSITSNWCVHNYLLLATASNSPNISFSSVNQCMLPNLPAVLPSGFKADIGRGPMRSQNDHVWFPFNIMTQNDGPVYSQKCLPEVAAAMFFRANKQ